VLERRAVGEPPCDDIVPRVKRDFAGTKKIEPTDWESMTGASQLGWLAIIVFLVGIAFMIRFAFSQGWISGVGQPMTLAILGTVIFVISDFILKKQYQKFGTIFTISSFILLSLSLYWPLGYLGSHSIFYLLAGTLFVWVLSLVWGMWRGSSLWPLCGLALAGFLPILALGHTAGNTELLSTVILVFAVSMLVSALRDWQWMPYVGSLAGILAVVSTIRLIGQEPTDSLIFYRCTLAIIPSMIIIWSSLVHLVKKREPQNPELLLWAFNNLVFLIFIAATWKRLQMPFILLSPIAANGVAFFSARRLLRGTDAKYIYYYLSGFVVSLAIAMTFLLPIPLDIIFLSLFTLYLAYLGGRQNKWQLKGLSGAMVIWCIIFLFAARFGFKSLNEIPFVNLRFASFAVAFLCFGYQGRMINDDPNAGIMGPFLGQGLFSLGLLVLLGGICGEILQVFPAEGEEKISQIALLGLTLVGAFFSFAVTYIGIALRLFFIRILALGIFAVLLWKLLWFDLSSLRPVYLMISLCVVAVLLAVSSLILKKFKRSNGNGNGAGAVKA
jgi:hypothetical protein